MRDNNCIYPIGLLGGLNEKTHEKSFSWCLVFNKCSINVSSEGENICSQASTELERGRCGVSVWRGGHDLSWAGQVGLGELFEEETFEQRCEM